MFIIIYFETFLRRYLAFDGLVKNSLFSKTMCLFNDPNDTDLQKTLTFFILRRVYNIRV